MRLPLDCRTLVRYTRDVHVCTAAAVHLSRVRRICEVHSRCTGATPTGLIELDLNSPEGASVEKLYGPYPVNRFVRGIQGNVSATSCLVCVPGSYYASLPDVWGDTGWISAACDP